MSFFYDNIKDGVLKQLEELKPEDRLEYLLLLKDAVEEIIEEQDAAWDIEK